MSEHLLVFDDRGEPDHLIDVGAGVTLRAYTPGRSENPGDYRVQHECKRWADEQEPDGEFVKIGISRATTRRFLSDDSDVDR